MACVVPLKKGDEITCVPAPDVAPWNHGKCKPSSSSSTRRREERHKNTPLWRYCTRDAFSGLHGHRPARQASTSQHNDVPGVVAAAVGVRARRSRWSPPRFGANGPDRASSSAWGQVRLVPLVVEMLGTGGCVWLRYVPCVATHQESKQRVRPLSHVGGLPDGSQIRRSLPAHSLPACGTRCAHPRWGRRRASAREGV